MTDKQKPQLPLPMFELFKTKQEEPMQKYIMQKRSCETLKLM